MVQKHIFKHESETDYGVVNVGADGLGTNRLECI